MTEEGEEQEEAGAPSDCNKGLRVRYRMGEEKLNIADLRLMERLKARLTPSEEPHPGQRSPGSSAWMARLSNCHRLRS